MPKMSASVAGVFLEMRQNCDIFILGNKKGLGISPKPFNFMVPRAGVEPARPYSRGILSPLRLPISPPRHRYFW